MKRIMILSSSYTGHGHKSIAQSIAEQLDAYLDVQYLIVDGFSLIGAAGLRMSKIYGPITRRAKDLWKMSYELSDQHPGALLGPISVAMHDRFLRKLQAFSPDLILTVHSFFNGSVLDILDFYNIKIPLYVLQADMINIHGSWCDPRAALTLCPTEEAYESSRQRGMPQDKLRLCGFPSRAQFCDAARAADSPEFSGGRPLNCLLMSGGEGSGNLQRYAEQLLAYVDCRLSVVCGRNDKLRAALNETLKARYGDRLTVYGFLDNVSEVMQTMDLVIARGSPNTLMESVVLGVPLLITGSLPGQEADNPALMVAHNLGVVCESAEALPAIVHALMKRDGARLREIRTAQRAYRNLDNAKEIARILRDAPTPPTTAIPKKSLLLYAGEKL